MFHSGKWRSVTQSTSWEAPQLCLGLRSEMPKMVLTAKSDSNACVFEAFPSTMRLRSHPGFGVGFKYSEERRFGPWRYIESELVAATDAVHAEWDGDFVMISAWMWPSGKWRKVTSSTLWEVPAAARRPRWVAVAETGSPTRTAPSAPSTTLTSFLASRVLYPAVHLPQSGASCPPHPINCRGDAPPAIDTYGEYYSYSYEGGDTCK